jgi:hypothetical protein
MKEVRGYLLPIDRGQKAVDIAPVSGQGAIIMFVGFTHLELLFTTV